MYVTVQFVSQNTLCFCSRFQRYICIQVDLKDRTSGWTPLMRCAALNGEKDVAEILLRGGADVNAVDM